MDKDLIEKLAREAGMYFAKDDFGDVPEIECKMDSLERFLAMIVDECIKAVHGEALEDPCNTPDDIAYDNAIRDAVGAIQTRFGA